MAPSRSIQILSSREIKTMIPKAGARTHVGDETKDGSENRAKVVNRGKPLSDIDDLPASASSDAATTAPCGIAGRLTRHLSQGTRCAYHGWSKPQNSATGCCTSRRLVHFPGTLRVYSCNDVNSGRQVLHQETTQSLSK